MRFRSTIATLAATCLLTLAGSSGTATAQDRPGLLDVPFTSVYGALPPGYSYNTLWVNLDETTPPAASAQSRVTSAAAAVEKPGADRISLRLYEPDSVSRKSNLAKMKQKDDLSLFVRSVIPTFTASGVVTGCKGQAQVKQNLDATKTYSWNYGCKSLDAAMQQIGVPAPIRSALTSEFKDAGFKMSGKQTQ